MAAVHDRRGVIVAGLVAIATGVVAGWWMPRGPVSTGQALAAMAMGLVVGVGAGSAMRSRWAMVVAPVAFVVTFELVRVDVVGPTVDAPRLDLYGALLLAVGRGVHGVLVLLPMLLGVIYVLGWLRWRGGMPPAGWFRRGVAGTASLGLIVLAVFVMRPATTTPILGPDGEPLAGSIAELTRVSIGGHHQALLIRGNDATNPVVLFLAGGPGGSELGVMGQYGTLLEQDFVVVTWDQRGTGKSYGSFEPVETLTFDQAVADTIEVSEYLIDRFSAERIYLLGESYGSLLAVKAAQQRPELYAAIVGSGQMVSPLETDQIFYEDAMAHAEHVGDAALLRTLRDLGEPPYRDPLDYLPLVASEQRWNDYSAVPGHESRREPTGSLGVPEYTLMDRVHSLTGLADTYAILYPQIQSVDLRRDVPRLDVPVYVVLGRYEARGRAEPALEWFEMLDAPAKQVITFEVSGHRPFVEELDRFHQVMTGTVLAETWDGHHRTVVVSNDRGTLATTPTEKRRVDD